MRLRYFKKITTGHVSHMVVPLNGAECVAVVRAETHMILCTISKQPLARAPTCKQASVDLAATNWSCLYG